jgi:hypothetical protein
VLPLLPLWQAFSLLFSFRQLSSEVAALLLYLLPFPVFPAYHLSLPQLFLLFSSQQPSRSFSFLPHYLSLRPLQPFSLPLFHYPLSLVLLLTVLPELSLPSSFLWPFLL